MHPVLVPDADCNDEVYRVQSIEEVLHPVLVPDADCNTEDWLAERNGRPIASGSGAGCGLQHGILVGKR